MHCTSPKGQFPGHLPVFGFLKATWQPKREAACGATEPDGPDGVVLVYGESDRALAFALVRWLGPGAEILAPAEWRAAFAAELGAMAARHA